ncbi:MAG TPA: protein-L-isoaspartate O-methyltransferase, partial [Accumulibacter sp.]|nr:protein-L-isoaspartate O-methyltransferase [Accumulibacter sp.]
LGVATQYLALIEKRGEDCVETRLDAVRFVPLLTGVE